MRSTPQCSLMRSWSRSATAKSPTARSTQRSASPWPVNATSSDYGPAPAVRVRSFGWFWMAVLTDLRNRGIKDVFFVVCDGLKGLPEVVSAVWPAAIVQTCIIHLIRNTFRLTSRHYWDEIKRDIKPIYTAVNASAARVAFEELGAKWGQRYPAMIRLWANAWEEFIPFLDYATSRFAR